MTQIPGFESAQRAWENMEPDDADECVDGDCDECVECMAAIIAQDQADDYADMQREERRLESRYGA